MRGKCGLCCLGLQASYTRLTGDVLEPVEIARRCDLGNTEARTVIEKYIDRLARGLASIINVLDPDVIVLGGGVSNLDVLYNEGVESVRKNVFNPTFTTPIIKPKLGDSAGVFGAALL